MTKKFIIIALCIFIILLIIDNILIISYINSNNKDTVIETINTESNIVELKRINDPQGYILSREILHKKSNRVYIYTYFYKVAEPTASIKILDRVEVLEIYDTGTRIVNANNK